MKYETGGEVTKCVTVDADTVEWGPFSRRLVQRGELLTKSSGSEAFGPYDPDATDGRQTLQAPAQGEVTAVIAAATVDCREGDQEIDGYFFGATFDYSELTRHGATWSELEAAFPGCVFDD